MGLKGGVAKFTRNPCRRSEEVTGLSEYIGLTSSSEKLGFFSFRLGAGSGDLPLPAQILRFTDLSTALAGQNSEKAHRGPVRLAEHLVVLLGDPALLDEEKIRRIAVAIHLQTILRDHPAICAAHLEKNRRGEEYVALHFAIANGGLDGRSLSAKRSNKALYRIYKTIHRIIERNGIPIEAAARDLQPISKSTPPPRFQRARRRAVRDEIAAKIQEVLEKSDSHRAFKAGLEASGLKCKFYQGADRTPRCAVGFEASKQMYRADRLEGLSEVSMAAISGFAKDAVGQNHRPRGSAVAGLGQLIGEVAQGAVLEPMTRVGKRRVHGGTPRHRRKRADPNDPLAWIEEALRGDDTPGID